MGRFLNVDQLASQEAGNIERFNNAKSLVAKDRKKAIEELEQLASSGSVLSMLYLGNLYKYGSNPDLSKSGTWYRAAYERGALDGIAGLGIHYLSQNRFEDADRVFTEGVNDNDSVSTYYLARSFVLNPKSRKSYQKIKELYERATDLGQVRSKNQLAFILMKGHLCFQNIARGVYLYFSSVVDGLRIAIRDPNDRRLW